MNKVDSTTFAFNQLPLELKREVLTHLDFSNLVRFEQVSKSAQFILSGLHCDFSQGYLTVKMPEKNNKGFQGSPDHLSFKEAKPKNIEWLKKNIYDVYDSIKYYKVLERVVIVSSSVFILGFFASFLPHLFEESRVSAAVSALFTLSNYPCGYILYEQISIRIKYSSKRQNKKLSDIALKIPQDLLSKEVQNYLIKNEKL